jgi:16S rRNA (guanine(966)-N(2))-methyltransferase RsmD
MRIINGNLSGRRPVVPKNLLARPTTDMAREGLFNILRNRLDFEDCRVLDLFSGTGIISYEFASLGCRDITCVERDRFHCAAIRKNFELLEIQSIRLIETDAFNFLKKEVHPFDFIFADPPYNHPQITDLPSLVIGKNRLISDGLFVLEHGPDKSFKNFPGFTEERNYGKVHFSFFKD